MSDTPTAPEPTVVPTKRTRAPRVAPVETPVVAEAERGELRDFGGVQFYIKG